MRWSGDASLWGVVRDSNVFSASAKFARHPRTKFGNGQRVKTNVIASAAL